MFWFAQYSTTQHAAYRISVGLGDRHYQCTREAREAFQEGLSGSGVILALMSAGRPHEKGEDGRGGEQVPCLHSSSIA